MQVDDLYLSTDIFQPNVSRQTGTNRYRITGAEFLAHRNFVYGPLRVCLFLLVFAAQCLWDLIIRNRH
jgi:hypothetical protein